MSEGLNIEVTSFFHSLASFEDNKKLDNDDDNDEETKNAETSDKTGQQGQGRIFDMTILIARRNTPDVFYEVKRKRKNFHKKENESLIMSIDVCCLSSSSSLSAFFYFCSIRNEKFLLTFS